MLLDNRCLEGLTCSHTCSSDTLSGYHTGKSSKLVVYIFQANDPLFYMVGIHPRLLELSVGMDLPSDMMVSFVPYMVQYELAHCRSTDKFFSEIQVLPLSKSNVHYIHELNLVHSLPLPSNSMERNTRRKVENFILCRKMIERI